MRKLIGIVRRKNPFISRGDDHLQACNYDAAIVMYTEALKEEPTNATVLTSRSFAYTMSTPQRLDLALQDAETAIRHDPKKWRAWLQKGDTLLKLRNVTGAEEAFAEAVKFAKGEDKLTARRNLANAHALRSIPAEHARTPEQPTHPGPSIPSTVVNPAPDSVPLITLDDQPTNVVHGSPGTNLPPTSGQPMPPLSAPLVSPSTTNYPRAVSNPVLPTSSIDPPTADIQASPTAECPHTDTVPLVSSTVTNPAPVPSNRVSPGASIDRPKSGGPTPQSSPTAIHPVTPTMQSTLASITNITRTFPDPGQLSSSNARSSGGGEPRSTAIQAGRSAPVTRPHDHSTVSEAPVSGLPLRPDDLIDLAPDNPPQYQPAFNHSDPTVRALSQQALETQLTQLETVLTAKNKGGVTIRPYTATGGVDAVKLVYVGLTQLDLTARELGTPTYLHPSFRNIAIDLFSYPGSTFLDMDCESSGYYEGQLPGTVSITGYSHEYREDQNFKFPLLNLVLEGKDVLPTMALDKIVDRIRLLQLRPTFEDNAALRDIVGMSQLDALQRGWNSANGRQRQIEAICMGLTRSLYDAPHRFKDFSKARNISNNTFGTSAQGIGLENFLFQILLGAELQIRLGKEPVTTSYTGLMTDAISSLVVLSALWMRNVTILGPFTATTTIPLGPRYKLVATQYPLQVEGLIRFGEALSWPYMDEARHYIEHAYNDLLSGKGVFGFDICDWLYGLILPGKIFRHRIMCCLVAASPSLRSIGPAPFWENGLIVRNKSYWTRRSVLGRVLGGLKNPKSVCGWIGPVPAPKGSSNGWIRLNARHVDIPVPALATETTSLQRLGFGQRDPMESPEALIESIIDPNEWIQGCPPNRPSNDATKIIFEGIHLTVVSSSPLTTTLDANKEYQASLEFQINGVVTTYTLYSNPLFVYAPPCVGTHTLHRRQVQSYVDGVIPVADLKEAYPASDSLVIIDATGKGEEIVARAWCAERGKHAVIRRDVECCFACAVQVTVDRTGLGFNVLIWSR